MTDDDAVDPDTKDWTWVLARPCPECGFEAAGLEGPENDRDQDATAREGRYAEREPAAVAGQLAAAAETIAARFDAVRAEQWERPGRRSNGSLFGADLP